MTTNFFIAMLAIACVLLFIFALAQHADIKGLQADIRRGEQRYDQLREDRNDLYQRINALGAALGYKHEPVYESQKWVKENENA